MQWRNQSLIIEGINVQLVRKRVKYLRLVVTPPDGRVRVSVPAYLPDDLVWMFLQERLEWIRQKQARFAGYISQISPQFVAGERHRLFGRACTLEVIERAATQRVFEQGDTLVMSVRPDSTVDARGKLLDDFYRAELKRLVPVLLDKWQPRIGRTASDWGIKKMKTRWGTCNVNRRRIWLNLELAKRPLAALEYVLVHELVHLLERGHNERFRSLMDSFMPDWREQRKVLNDQWVGSQE